MLFRDLHSRPRLVEQPRSPSPSPRHRQADRAAGLAHIAAAKQAAGYEVAELYDHTCARLMVGAALPFGRIYPPDNPRDPAKIATEPVKVFDNLYYVGEKMLHGASPSAWAVTTSEGIILIDTMFEDSMKALILGGFTKMNLDPGESQVHPHHARARRSSQRHSVPPGHVQASRDHGRA